MFNQFVKTIQKTQAIKNPRNLKTDYLRTEIANRMADRLLDIKREFVNVLDFGAGSGHLIKEVDGEMLQKLVQYDSSYELLHRDQNTSAYEVETERIVGNMESLPFKEGEFDAVLSCLAMHWINDLPGVMSQLHKCLKPDGVLMASLFGGDTLYELRTSLQLAETERSGGISPHISPMVRHQDMGSLLSRSGFTLTTVDQEEITVNYPSMFELMEDLKAMGENNALYNRKHHTSRDVFLAADAAYRAIYGNADGSIPATFQIIHMIGWKPHESQPKPLKRGSATMSFKDLDKFSPKGKE